MINPEKEKFASKATARAFARTRRGGWSREEIAALGDAIAARVFATSWWAAADTLLCYVGALPGELDTRVLIQAALDSGRKVRVPLTRSRGDMDWVALRDCGELVRTPRGLLEPVAPHIPMTRPTDGLCIVPGMLFRPDGHRLGFGGGYYDRFLASFSGTTVGLCPASCLGHDFPVADHDRPVQAIVTEESSFLASRDGMD